MCNSRLTDSPLTIQNGGRDRLRVEIHPELFTVKCSAQVGNLQDSESQGNTRRY